MSTEIELPGMEELERVEPPFEKQRPRYRVQWRLIVTGYATFTTWEDPEAFTEDDANTEGFYDEIIDDPHSEVDYDSSWYQQIEVLQEDGTWKPVDASTYERIAAYAEDAA